MPLHVSPAPAAARRSIAAALGSPDVVRAPRTPPAVRAAHGALRADLALPLHVLDRIGDPGRPPRTRLTGWRFVLRSGQATVGAAEALLTTDGWAFSHFSAGPYITSSEHALRQAEALATAHQPRLLSVPELYMLTLWLHGDTGADPADGVPAPADLLVPLAPAPPGIGAHQPQRVDRLLPVLTGRLAAAPLLEASA